MHVLAVLKTISLGYLLGLSSLGLATALWGWLRPRLAPAQRADAGFTLLTSTFALSSLLAVAICLGVLGGNIRMTTPYFHQLMHGTWAAMITSGGLAVLAASIVLAIDGWLRGRTPRRTGAPVATYSGLAVVSHAAISTAGLVGCWRPQVWVNPDYWEQLTEAERELALAHELVHLRRRDNLRKLTLQFLTGFYAAVPFARRWSESYELDCELAVDDACRCKLDEREYTGLIARSAQFALGGSAQLALAGAATGGVDSGLSHADLRQRLAVLGAPRQRPRQWAGRLIPVIPLLSIAPGLMLLSHALPRCLLACYLGY